MEVNVKAPLFLIQMAIKSMRERSEGTIIAISSDAGVLNFRKLTSTNLGLCERERRFLPLTIAGLSAYCSSK